MRKCSNCFTHKPVTEFYVKRGKSYRNGIGLQSRCKGCSKEVAAAYAARKKARIRDAGWAAVTERKRIAALEAESQALRKTP